MLKITRGSVQSLEVKLGDSIKCVASDNRFDMDKPPPDRGGVRSTADSRMAFLLSSSKFIE